MKKSSGSEKKNRRQETLFKKTSTCVLECRNSTPSWLMQTTHGEGQPRWLTFSARKVLDPNRGRELRTSEKYRI